MARRPGYTLLELLVVMAILAVLLAVLAPTVASARAMALKVVCVTRLRDLTMAANQYRITNHAYPLQPGTTVDPLGLLASRRGPRIGGPVVVQPPKPTDLEPAFLNALQPFLKFPRLGPQAGTDDLPHVVQCPTVEDAAEEARTGFADLAFVRPTLYTGYAYCVRPRDATLAPSIKLLKAKRAAAPKLMEADTVVWADDVQWSRVDAAWKFAHGVPRAEQGLALLSYARADGLLGQHLAFTDGHVEWRGGAEVDLDIRGGPDAPRKATMSVFDLFFSWF